jgi:hypothetical protein
MEIWSTESPRSARIQAGAEGEFLSLWSQILRLKPALLRRPWCPEHSFMVAVSKLDQEVPELKVGCATSRSYPRAAG